MEEVNRNDISQIASKIGKFIIICFIIELLVAIIYEIFETSLLVDYTQLIKIDIIEIDMIVRSLTSTLSAIFIGLFIFKPNIKGIFSKENKKQILSLKSKVKLTILFLSISLFSTIISSYIMVFYGKHVHIPMPETAVFLSIFAILIAPIIEEILYRGIFLNYLKGVGSLFSLIISSIYFGVNHGIGFLHAFIIGLILGLCYILTGNIGWSIILHFLHNLSMPLVEYLSLPSFPNITYNIKKLIIATILFLIFFITTIKDKEIKKLFNKLKMKDIIAQFKREKKIFSAFVNEPVIIIIIMGCFFLQMIPIFVG